MNKKSLFLMTIICFLLTLAIGYAFFSDTITVEGTASGQGILDMKFSGIKVVNEVGSTGSLGEISSDGNKVDITVPKLEYPGAYAEFEIEVINNSAVASYLKSVGKTNLTEDQNIKVSYTNLDEVIGTKMIQNDKHKFNVKVMWDVASTAASSNVEFTLDLNYEQYID